MCYFAKFCGHANESETCTNIAHAHTYTYRCIVNAYEIKT